MVVSKCKQCICEQVCRFNDGHNLYCKEDYECPHFVSKSLKNISNALYVSADDCEIPTVNVNDIKNDVEQFLKERNAGEK